MRYNPRRVLANCGVEYRPGFRRCSDCHVELVEELPLNRTTPGAEEIYVRAPALAYGLPIAVIVFFVAAIFTGPKSMVRPYVLFTVLVIILISNCGTIWMLYQLIRFEKKPRRYAPLALIPYSFYWYYYVRIAGRRRSIAAADGPPHRSSGSRLRYYALIALAYAGGRGIGYRRNAVT